MQEKLFFFGVGNTARWVAAQSQGRMRLYGTTRDSAKVSLLEKCSIEAILITEDFINDKVESLRPLLKDAYVLASYPPDAIDDERFSQLANVAKGIIYISSTHVYGRRTGDIDESTVVDTDLPSAKPRLQAERLWQKQGAVVLRPPALYGPGYGLHMRLQEGLYSMPEDGSNYTSRIHFLDLARLILASFEKTLAPGSTYLVGDLQPTTQKEVVSWLCERMNLPMPPCVPFDAVSERLKVNRRISAKKILAELGVELVFPTYKEGFEHCLNSADAQPCLAIKQS